MAPFQSLPGEMIADIISHLAPDHHDLKTLNALSLTSREFHYACISHKNILITRRIKEKLAVGHDSRLPLLVLRLLKAVRPDQTKCCETFVTGGKFARTAAEVFSEPGLCYRHHKELDEVLRIAREVELVEDDGSKVAKVYWAIVVTLVEGNRIDDLMVESSRARKAMHQFFVKRPSEKESTKYLRQFMYQAQEELTDIADVLRGTPNKQGHKIRTWKRLFFKVRPQLMFSMIFGIGDEVQRMERVASCYKRHNSMLPKRYFEDHDIVYRDEDVTDDEDEEDEVKEENGLNEQSKYEDWKVGELTEESDSEVEDTPEERDLVCNQVTVDSGFMSG